MQRWPEVADFLGLVKPTEREALLEGSQRITLPAAAIIDLDGTPTVIESGLTRVFHAALDGRQASIGYLRAHEMFGNVSPVEPLPPARVQMVYDTVLLRLDPTSVRRVFDEDIEVWKIYASVLVGYLVHTIAIINIRSLGSIRERLAFDLLERAAAEQLRSGRLAVLATHEELANSIGSVREVVTNQIGEFKRDGIVATQRGETAVLDAARLWTMVRALVT